MKKTFVITGTSSGIGKAGLQDLLARGYRIIAHARDDEKAQQLKEEMLRAVPGSDLEVFSADLSRMKAVKEFAQRIREQLARWETKLDGLWNNAGAMLSECIITDEGFETQMAVNHLAPFLLTAALRDLLAPDARVITTSSGAHFMGSFDWKDWLAPKQAYSPFGVYSRTKLANALFSMELGRQFDLEAGSPPASQAADQAAVGLSTPAGRKRVAHCFHPGFVRTGFGQAREGSQGFDWVNRMNFMMISPEQGADTGVFLLSDEAPSRSQGLYWSKRKPRLRSRRCNPKQARLLWEETEKALQAWL